jgi:hypothetical protein
MIPSSRRGFCAREIVKSVIARSEATKQSSAAMQTGLLRFARNDGTKRWQEPGFLDPGYGQRTNGQKRKKAKDAERRQMHTV